MKAILGYLQGVISRMRKRGVVIRSREERLQEILEYVRREYPEAQREDLVDDINGLALPIQQEEWCKGCHPSRCPTGGRLWFIERREGVRGIVYYPWFQTCGKWRAWRMPCEAPRVRDQDSMRGFRGGALHGEERVDQEGETAPEAV